MRGRRARAALIAAVVFLTGACGIPVDHDAHVVEIGNFVREVERGLTAQNPIDDRDGAPITVYMIAPGQELRLVAMERIAPYLSIDQILKQLLFGPAGDEWSRGIRSAISSQAKLRNVVIVDGQAFIDIQRPLVETLGTDYILALAQIVVTATEVPGINRVRLSLDEVDLSDAPTDDGTSTSGALTRKDYASFLPK